jgi:nondiscriminating aspartyl-tRNA synthetase
VSPVSPLFERLWTTDLTQHVGERVQLSGWLHHLRQLSSVSFLILRDAKGLAQVVLDRPEALAALEGVYHESVLAVEGLVVAEPQAPGGIEIHDPAITVITRASEPPPFDLFRPKLKAQLPAILDHAPVALRHPAQRSLFRLSAESMNGFRTVLRGHDFTEIQTPKIVASSTESGANVFALNYFGQPAYLAQSPQFYKQMMVGIFERVFEVGPVFRAEPHSTTRHLNEYVSMDVEMGFIRDHRDVMAVLEMVITGMAEALRQHAADDLARLKVEMPLIPAAFPAIHFSDALEMIFRETGEDARREPDLAPAHERWLGEWARREHDSDFLFVVGYPMVKRPFYTHPDPERPQYSNSFDLLFRGMELVTGGQRLHRYEDYLASLQRHRLDPALLEGYLQAFKHGMPPHGGFAIGLERWVAQLAGVANVRETTLFPRDLNRLAP